MSDISVNATNFGIITTMPYRILSVTAIENVTKAQAAYIDPTTGKFGIADANVAGKQQLRGVFLETQYANYPVDLLLDGYLFGYDLSGLNYGALLYLSDTAGAFADAVGTLTVHAGRVFPINDSTLTKAFYLQSDWLRTWA